MNTNFMKVKQQDVFQTRLHIVENFLEQNEFNALNELVTEDKKLLDVPDFEVKILKIMPLICDNLGVALDTYDTIEITETWGNVLEKGQDHKVHTHSNHLFSCVYYLTPGNPTVFLDPRPAADVLSLNYKDMSNCFYGSTLFSPAVPNTLVIFPSWLQHLVGVNQNEEVRKSISSNIMFRGTFSIGETRQQIKL